jgi:adenine C2-methylase RlmN of 23S rRNA A2503 and tRNA A37
VKYLYSEGKILQDGKEYFCRFLRDILDIRKKGYIDEDDIESFFESLENSELDIRVLNEIKELLGRYLLADVGSSRRGGRWTAAASSPTGQSSTCNLCAIQRAQGGRRLQAAEGAPQQVLVPARRGLGGLINICFYYQALA